jgi:hypothetical protein
VLVATGYYPPGIEFDLDDLRIVIELLNESRK